MKMTASSAASRTARPSNSVRRRGILGLVTAGLTALLLAAPAAAAAPVISTVSLPAAQVGAVYSQSLAATGGTAPYSWALAAGALPAGIALDPSTGGLVGTPTAAGTATFTVRVTDAVAGTTTKDLLIAVSAATLAVSTSTLPAAQIGVAYGQTLVGAGGTPPYTWSMAAGNLPAGLALVASTGVISGSPTTIGTATFTVRATDATALAVTKALSITVGAAAPLTIVTAALPAGQVNVAYSGALVASGGSAPYSWSLSAGLLPVGLALEASTGLITGVPTSVVTASFTARVTDGASATATQALSIAVGPSEPLSVTTTTLPDGQMDVGYGAVLTASGGVPPYSWVVIGGALPAGLVLDTSGQISGTPLTTGTYSATLQLTDSLGASAQGAVSIVILSATGLLISTDSLSVGAVGAVYADSIEVVGGTTPYYWLVTAGTLPPGLNLDSNSGSLTGVPSAAGDYSFTVAAYDAVGLSAARALTISVSGQTLEISDLTLPGASVGSPYSAGLSVSGGTSPYAWSLTSGNLPTGLSLDRSSGAITGTTDGAGNSTFTVQVVDTLGQVATRQFSIAVTGSGFIGSAPAPGTIALLVARGSNTPSGLVGALAGGGCTVESLAVLRSGRWAIFVNGAPAVVNLAFPATLDDLTAFFVRCR